MMRVLLLLYPLLGAAAEAHVASKDAATAAVHEVGEPDAG